MSLILSSRNAAISAVLPFLWLLASGCNFSEETNIPLPQTNDLCPKNTSNSHSALVIGIDNYKFNSSLANARSDAAKVGQKLCTLGYSVRYEADLDKTRFVTVLDEFGERTKDSDVAIVYYAGHAIQVPDNSETSNYLMPSNGKLSNYSEAKSLINLKDLEYAVSRSAWGVVFLDACRNNPMLIKGMTAESRGSLTTGAMLMGSSEENVVTVYATDSGQVAADSGLFAQSLVDNLDKPIDVAKLLRIIKQEVRIASGNTQVPGFYSKLEGKQDYILSPKSNIEQGTNLAPSGNHVLDHNSSPPTTTSPLAKTKSEVIGGTSVLKVTTKPAGAKVFLSGVYIGLTPLVRDDLINGDHNLVASHRYFVDYEKKISLENGIVAPVEVELESAYGDLTVTSDPSYASIYIDEIKQDLSTPATIRSLIAGVHSVRVEKTRYESSEKTIELSKDALYVDTHSLKAIPYGKAAININPSDAAVSIDSKNIRDFSSLELPEGHHEILVSRQGYVSQKLNLEIRNGAVTNRKVDLERDCTEHPVYKRICDSKIENIEAVISGVTPLRDCNYQFEKWLARHTKTESKRVELERAIYRNCSAEAQDAGGRFDAPASLIELLQNRCDTSKLYVIASCRTQFQFNCREMQSGSKTECAPL